MKTNFRFALLLIVTLAAAAYGQTDKTFFQTIEGRWKGTLEYQDYTSNKRVTMNTIITFTPSADGKSATVLTIYDDFGKIYKANGRERIEGDRFFDDETEFAIESSDPGRIVLIGRTQDGNTIEPTRKTITYTNDSLTILKETRTPWQFRNVYTLKRLVETKQPDVVLAPARMQEDAALLKKALVTLHPGIYRYNTPASIEREFAALNAQLSKPLTEGAYFVLVSQLLNKLNCGHTYTNPYNQDSKLKERLLGQRNYLPFYFDIIDGRMIITANASSKDISAGSEILKINGVEAKEIIEKLLTVTKADGTSTHEHRINSIALTRNEAESYALFDIYFPLFFPVKDEIYDIEAKGFTSGKTASFSVLAMTKAERTEAIAKRYGPTPTYDDGWKFEIRDGGLGYLKIDNSITWRLKTIKFEEFLAQAFAELRAKDVKKLIIDLRGNGGGSMDPGFYLSRYLARKKLPPYAAGVRLVRNVAAQPELLKFISTYSDELIDALKVGVPAKSYRKFDKNYFQIVGREEYPAVEPFADNFLGEAYIIADSSNASATFQFLNYAQQNKLATIVGQPTGGSKQGINGGNYYFLKLPNSLVEIDIPVYYQAPSAKAKDEPVIPDVVVKRQPEDIGNKTDRAYEIAARR